MPRAYSADLRERVLAAYEGGEGSRSALARRHRVGERTLLSWLKAAREEGRRAPKPRRGGRAPVGGADETHSAGKLPRHPVQRSADGNGRAGGARARGCRATWSGQ